MADTLDGFKERIMALPGMDLQVGYGLLCMSVFLAPVFLSQVTPPLLTHDLFERFDESMVDCATALLGLPWHEELACESRLERAQRRLQLPIRHKGGGVASVALRYSIAYLLADSFGEQGRVLLRAHRRAHAFRRGHASARAAGAGAGVAPHGVSGGSGVHSGTACAAEAAALC
jgi:hypothetical protein